MKVLLNDLVMFNVLDISAFCMLNKALSAFVLPRSRIIAFFFGH